MCFELKDGLDYICHKYNVIIGYTIYNSGKLATSYDYRADKLLQEKILQGLDLRIKNLSLMDINSKKALQLGLEITWLLSDFCFSIDDVQVIGKDELFIRAIEDIQ